MKNLIFMLIFLLGFLSNNTVFAVANKATYSEKQIIHNIPKQKKLSYLEKVLSKKIRKNAKLSDSMFDLFDKIGVSFLLVGLATIPFFLIGLSLEFSILAGFILALVLSIIVLFIDTGGRIGGC